MARSQAAVSGGRSGEKWGEGAVDSLVVGVQPGEGFGAEEFRDDCRGVEMTAGEGLEIEPVSEFACAGLAAEDYVLVTDAVHAFPI